MKEQKKVSGVKTVSVAKTDEPNAMSEVPKVKTFQRVYYPPFWKKKKLNPKFVKELQTTANSEPLATDKYGEYRAGTFLHGCAIIVVAFNEGLWSLEIHSEHLIGFPLVEEARYKFIPDDCLMARLLPSREQKQSASVVVLYQIPGTLKDEPKTAEK